MIPHWKPIGFSPHHGIALPLSSLHTKQSCGIGEFLDLIPLIDWCKKMHFDCIQLLPLNDTSGDPSPYNPISSCALDPIYLSLSPFNISCPLPLTQRLNRPQVLQTKLELLYAHYKKSAPPPASFIQQNPWLHSYADFKAQKGQPDRDFTYFLQYHCFAQMEQVRAHATSQHIFLQGDIPILLSPDSADVKASPHLFHTNLVAGAPPDLYAPLGQKWGFPLFNWPAMREDHFSWWKQRLSVAERLFHIYRIDHVVGFFRIWGIPKDKKPTEGSFFPPDTKDWFPQGRELLQMMLNATPMLPIAEDLGTIPKGVYPILKELEICSTKVIRWQRNWDTDKSYIPFDQYEPISMTTLSTHDMDPLELWWKKYPAESVPFAAFMKWPYHPILSNKYRFEILRAAHHTSSIFHINPLQEYLALYPELVWPNPADERINVPGTLLPTNWTYRFRPSLEEITAHDGLASSLAQILKL